MVQSKIWDQSKYMTKIDKKERMWYTHENDVTCYGTSNRMD